MPKIMTQNDKTYEPTMHGIPMNGIVGANSGYLASNTYLPPPPIGQQQQQQTPLGIPPLGGPVGQAPGLSQTPMGGAAGRYSDPALGYTSWNYNTRPELNRAGSSSYYLSPNYAFSSQQGPPSGAVVRNGSTASYQLPSLNTLLSSIQAPISRNLPLPGSKPLVAAAEKPLDYSFHSALPPLLNTDNASNTLTVTNKAPKSVASQNYYTASGNPRKHICKTCGKGFTTSGHLARHNRIHTGVKNHVCSFAGCDARFSRQDNCIQHYKTHLKAKKGQRKMRL